MAGSNSFTLPAPVMLERGTKYHIHITRTSGAVRPRGEYVLGLSAQRDSLDGLSFNQYLYQTFRDDPWEYVAGIEEALQLTLRGAVNEGTPATGAPTVSGTAQVGEILAVDVSGIAGEDGLNDVSFGYQWLADGADIPGGDGLDLHSG